MEKGCGSLQYCNQNVGRAIRKLRTQKGLTQELLSGFAGIARTHLAMIENGCKIATLVHPTAYVSPTVHIAEGVAVLPHAIVNTGCKVKAGCIINCGAITDHGCVLEEGVHVCLGAIVKAENRIPRCMKIEAGEIVANRTYPV